MNFEIVGDIIKLLCGVSLFLFGMLLMGNGLKSVAGSKLELTLYRLSNTPLKGVLLGTGVTAVIQSSSATSIMVVGFVNSRMMKVRQAIGIVLGAILGTSITGWIICLSEVGGGASSWVSLISTATITGVVAVVGIILRMFCKSKTKNRVGDILLGFAILMTGMSTMSASVAFLQENEAFIGLLTSFKNPIIGILAGLIITAVLQSASATVGILQVLSVTGAVSFEIAFPIIMGIAIGAAVPVLVSAFSAGVEGKRTAFSYLLADVLGTVITSIVFYSLDGIIGFSFMGSTMNMISIAFVNTLFRFATVVVLTPCIPLMEKIVCGLFKDKNNESEEFADIERLEDRFIRHPSVAIEQSNIAVCSMAIKAKNNITRAFELLGNYTEEKYDEIQEKEDVIDKYEDSLGTYLVKLTGSDLSPAQGREVSKILHAIGDFERIGDHAANLSKVAKEMHEKGIEFTGDAQDEMNVLVSAVSEIVRMTVNTFVENDVKSAAKVEPLEEVIDNLCDEIKINHVKRVSLGGCTLSHGFVFNDLLTNYERIADHCSNIAVAMIELDQDLFDTHEYLNDIKKNKSEVFNEYYEMYDKQFVLNK